MRVEVFVDRATVPDGEINRDVNCQKARRVVVHADDESSRLTVTQTPEGRWHITPDGESRRFWLDVLTAGQPATVVLAPEPGGPF